MVRCCGALSRLIWLLGIVLIVSGAARSAETIPWGAMYTPNEHLTDAGMTGAIKAYRGPRGAEELLEDLDFAREAGVRLILTLGSVAPATYLDDERRLDMAAVEAELAPFFAMAQSIRPFIDDGTVWGIRFLDEPHDPADLPRGFEIDPDELGEAYALIAARFGDVRIGSTAPPAYMARVPGADFASGQIVHGRLPSGYGEPVDFHRGQSELAHSAGLAYVASLNANTNGIDNLTFFRDYRMTCAIETVDFATSWQWPRGHHPQPSFSERLLDADPEVRAEIDGIPAACTR